jgi:hypothetical protein
VSSRSRTKRASLAALLATCWCICACACANGAAHRVAIPPAACKSDVLPNAAGSFELTSFGAKCDGSTADDAALELALAAANAHGGAVLLPSGRTCVLRSSHNLGNVNGTGRPAAGVTIRGTAMYNVAPSTLLFAPLHPSDIPECSTQTGGGFLTGDHASLTAAWVTFEDLVLEGGPNFSSCLLNETNANSGDAIHITTRRTQFLGKEAASVGGIYLSDASYIVVDSCYFFGLAYAIDGATTINGTDGSYVNNLVITNSTFYSKSTYHDIVKWSKVDPNFVIHLPSAAAVTGLHMTGNAFEWGPSALYIYRLQGGDITSNWFRGEATESPGSGTWIRVEAGRGFSITGNYINQGYNGIYTQGYGALVEANQFEGTFGTAIRLQAGEVVVAANSFRGAPGQDQIDIDVISGSAHRIGPNSHETNSVRYYVNMRSGSVGELFATSSLLSKVNDLSDGGWTTFVADTGACLPPSRCRPAAVGVLRAADGACYRLDVAPGGAIRQPLPAAPCP